MIACGHCGACDEEAMDMKYTMSINGRTGEITNLVCRMCGSHELRMLDMGPFVLILEEWEEEQLSDI